MNQQPNQRQQRVEQTSPFWIDALAIFLIFATFLCVTLFMMNMKREIVSIDKEIADYNSQNEHYRCQIENQRKEVEALKNSNAVEFAAKYKMVMPQIGMTRNMDGNYYEDERMMYAKRNGSGKGGTHNVASILPQFIKKHFED